MLLPNLPPPVEGIKHQSNSVDAYISRRCIGTGTLYIAESRLSWAKDNSTDGLSLEYPHIAIHAISRDSSNFEHPCLYLMLDIDIDEPSAADGLNGHHSDNDEDDGGDGESPEMTEIRFVPRDADHLDFMYKSLNECQLLHPDPEDANDPDYGFGNEFDDYDGPEDVEDIEEDIADGMEGDYETNGTNGFHDDDDHQPGDDVDMGQFDDV